MMESKFQNGSNEVKRLSIIQAVTEKCL